MAWGLSAGPRSAFGLAAAMMGLLVRRRAATLGGERLCNRAGNPGAGGLCLPDERPRDQSLAGSRNTPVSISPGGSQSFVIGFAPNAPVVPTEVALGSIVPPRMRRRAIPGLTRCFIRPHRRRFPTSWLCQLIPRGGERLCHSAKPSGIVRIQIRGAGAAEPFWLEGPRVCRLAAGGGSHERTRL
jgi:hypothetical protein